MTKWIKASDCLPENSGSYLALWTHNETNETFVAQAYFSKKIGFCPSREESPVTHWMPLPEVPNE